jgi:hypothetical protein
MNHPEKILRILDGHLIEPTRLILYGRAALALGFENAPPSFHTTLDVDAILPEVEMSSIEADDQFWAAIEKTNDQLASTGLYITHLFTDSQVILSSDWLTHLQPIELPELKHLRLFRPATRDLILTKMMRVDPQDRSDIEFLLSQSAPDPSDLERLFASANVPDIPEIADAFRENIQWLRQKVSKT